MRKAVNIVWDNEEEGNYGYAELPGSVAIPDGIPEDGIADFLSDKYGWCVCSYSIEEDETKDEQNEELRGWDWSVLNADGDILGEDFDYETKEEAEAAAMEYIEANSITDYTLDVSQPDA